MRGLLCAALIGLSVTPALAQGQNQYSGWKPRLPDGMLKYYEPHPDNMKAHPFHEWCCNEQDCAFARPGTIIWTPEGYRVTLPDGEVQIVPEDDPTIRSAYQPGFESEARAAACVMGKDQRPWSFIDQYSPTARQSKSKYFVRCLYPGRSGQ